MHVMTKRGLNSVTSQLVAVSVWTVNANTQLAAVFYALPCLLKSRVCGNKVVYLHHFHTTVAYCFIENWFMGMGQFSTRRCTLDVPP
jgi:hypothetical protein